MGLLHERVGGVLVRAVVRKNLEIVSDFVIWGLH